MGILTNETDLGNTPKMGSEVSKALQYVARKLQNSVFLKSFVSTHTSPSIQMLPECYGQQYSRSHDKKTQTKHQNQNSNPLNT